MNLGPSHFIFLAGLATYLCIRGVFQRQVSRGNKAVSHASVRDGGLVILTGLSQIAFPLVFLFTPWLDWANVALPPAAMVIGMPVMVAGLWLFWRSHADLGHSWSVSLELKENHRLVTQGVYRRIRHPMYASFFLLALSQALLLHNGFAGMAALVAVSLLYVRRVPHEEAMMLSHFGDDYRAYMKRTGGIVPRLKAADAAVG